MTKILMFLSCWKLVISLSEIGQSKAGKDCHDAVLAVPLNFTEDQKNLLR